MDPKGTTSLLPEDALEIRLLELEMAVALFHVDLRHTQKALLALSRPIVGATHYQAWRTHFLEQRLVALQRVAIQFQAANKGIAARVLEDFEDDFQSPGPVPPIPPE